VTEQRGKVRRGAAGTAAPRPVPDPPRRILLVSYGASPITRDVLQKTIALATPEQAKITVLGIARIFGTALGLPHPGLKPNRLEWEEQRNVVQEAADELGRRGFDVLLAMAMARNAPKLIARWVRARNFHAVVIPDPARPAWRRRIEGDLDHEIERRAHVPVHAVPIPAPARKSSRGAGP
jgi:K+-sensing histidine kinase KdpD